MHRETKIVAAPARLQRAPQIKRAPVALSHVAADGTFAGYASLFGLVDLGNDLVVAGAFRDSLARRGIAGVRMLWQHDAAEPLGAWLSIAEDMRGLRVTGRLNLAVARAREALALMREGALDGLSIGFRAERSRRDRKSGVRHLLRVDLWEISLVTFPMLPQARVDAVKRGYPGNDGIEPRGGEADLVCAAFARAARLLRSHSGAGPRI